MENGDIGSIIGIGMLVLCSAFFSAAETAFSSLNRIRVMTFEERGSKRASMVLTMCDGYNELLSTILVGNNIVNISIASIATVFFVRHLGDIGVTVSTVVITVTVLIFAEVTPKTIAKESPEKIALFSAPLLRILIILLTPVNALFARWKKLVSKVFMSSEDRSFTEEELRTIIDEAEREGVIGEEDKELMSSAIDFNDSKVNDIFTPRVDIISVSNNASPDEISDLFIETGYSRIPVYDGSIDKITGVLHVRDFFEFIVKKKKNIAEIITPVVFITPHFLISDLLKTLQSQKCHFAVVIDEYGGTIGIVTMEDILEELVGEIWDEHDEITEEFIALENGSYKIKGSASIDEMLEFFGITDNPMSSTVGGWVIERFGNIPNEGDTFNYRNLNVIISKADERKVVEITVSTSA